MTTLVHGFGDVILGTIATPFGPWNLSLSERHAKQTRKLPRKR